jgi:hypothetical protein
MEKKNVVSPGLKLPWLVVLATATVAPRPAAAEPSWAPTGAFLQLGVAEDTSAATAGLIWRWSRQWAFGRGSVSGYWAAAISGWRYEAANGAGDSDLGQLSFTPVFRYTPEGGDAPWFIEGGIGLTYTNKVYAPEGRTFSTRFNFGDQIAIGAYFGPAREYEVSLRFEHFSNAGIERPNPGQNFIQLRLSLPLP